MSLVVPLDFVEQLARQRSARPALLAHPRASGGLQAEDAILARHVAGDSDAALARIGRGGAAARDGHRAAPTRSHVLHGLRGGRGVLVQGGLGRAAVAFHRVGCRTVSSVRGAMFAQEFVVCRVRFVPGTPGQGVGHGECAGHFGDVWVSNLFKVGRSGCRTRVASGIRVRG